MTDLLPKYLDLSNQGIRKLPKDLPSPDTCLELNVDSNEFTRLENFDQFKRLRKLSVRQNRLVKVIGLSKLSELVELDLSGNALQSVENLKSLRLLEKLNLSGNNIKTYSLLNSNQKLRQLDLSSNGISGLSDISGLKDLRTLDLSRNIISSISLAEKCFPSSLVSLDLTENEIEDLCEISCLQFLSELEYLGFAQNSCVSHSISSYIYRAFVVNWCYKVKILDLKPVSQQERLKAEWLFSHGLGRRFSMGQHSELVSYLSKLSSSHDTDTSDTQKSAIESNDVPVIVREAWVGANGHHNVHHTVVNGGHNGLNSDDLQVEDVRDSIESNLKLQSESVFLPVDGETGKQTVEIGNGSTLIHQIRQQILTDPTLTRPTTAPSAKPVDAVPIHLSPKSARNETVKFSSPPLIPSHRPKTSPGSVTKYEEYDSRPVRPMNKDLLKELYVDKSPQSQPQEQHQQVSHFQNHKAKVTKPSPKVPSKDETIIKNGNGISVAKTNTELQPNGIIPRNGKMRSDSSSSGSTSKVRSKNSTAAQANGHPRFNARHTLAATKIQAMWRGFHIRQQLQPKLRELEQRRLLKIIAMLVETQKSDAEKIRRLEENIAERDRQENKARKLQTAAIKQVWDEITTLKSQMVTAMTNASLDSKKTTSSSTVSDENSPCETVGVGHSIVSETAQSISNVALSSSPSRRVSQQLMDMGITRRSPYAVRQREEAPVQHRTRQAERETRKMAIAAKFAIEPISVQTTSSSSTLADANVHTINSHDQEIAPRHRTRLRKALVN